MKKTLLLITLLPAYIFIIAQNSAGKAYHVDYTAWDAGDKPSIYIDCGNNNQLNTGYELSMEVWVRVYDSQWNQKIFGKMSDELNDGFVQGLITGKNYAEIKAGQDLEVQSGAFPRDSAWVHLATTYTAGDKLIAYVNGEKVGETDAPANAIASNNAPFVIGLAPWDLYSYMFFGNLDEIRIWNVSLNQEQIKQNMHKHLNGDEAGLVAYYNFNDAENSNVPDVSGNGNTGTVTNGDNSYWDFVPSYAPLGDDVMKTMTDILAIWCGKSEGNFNSAPSENGLSVITDITEKEFEKHCLFGHNNAEGVSLENLPTEASNDFKRVAREWYFNSAGNFLSTFYINTTYAAGSGDVIPLNSESQYYTLLGRNSSDEAYTPVSHANRISGSALVFENVKITYKYYTIGLGSTVLAGPSAIDKNELVKTEVYPNPSKGQLTITNAQNASITVYSLIGKEVFSGKLNSNNELLDLHNQQSGIYILKITKSNSQITQRIILNN